MRLPTAYDPEAVAAGGDLESAGEQDGTLAATARDVRQMLFVILAPAVCMLGLGLWGLDRGGMWRDEAVTYTVALRSPAEIWGLLPHVDAVHGLYYFLMHVVLSLGHNEVMLRLPSVIASAVTTGIVAAIGRRLSGPAVGLWAGLLYAVTPMVSHFAQEGRSYALVTCAATAATFLLLRAMEAPTARRWCAYGAALLLAVLLHEFALLVLCAHAATLLMVRATRRQWRGWCGAALVVVLMVAPLIAMSQGQAAQVSWISRPDGQAVWYLLRSFAGGGGIVVGTVVILGILAALDRRRGTRKLVQIALPLCVVPPTILMAVSQLHALYVPRYVLFSLAGVSLLAAQGLDCAAQFLPGEASTWRRPVMATGVAVIAIGFIGHLDVQRGERRPASRPDDLAAVARVIGTLNRGSGAGILFVPDSVREAALAYPSSFTGLQDVSLGAAGAGRGNLYGDAVTPDVMQRRLQRVRYLWVLQQRRLALTEQDDERLRMVDGLFRPADVHRVRSLRITRYVRR